MKIKFGFLTSRQLFFILLILVLLLASLSLAKAKGLLIPEQPPVQVIRGTIALDSLTLEQKIAQMVIVAGGRHNVEAWRSMQLGGIHLFALQDEQLYQQTIQEFQEGVSIPFLVTVDLEGCRSPFAHFREFPAATQISTVEEAFVEGREEGEFLSSLGFSVNFAPVVDLHDTIWNCRTFPGNETEIAVLAEAYISGLQEQGILATAKHYPGKTLVVRDPHKFLVAGHITAEDVYPYHYLTQQGKVDLVMVSHVITMGEIDSQGIPAVASPPVVNQLKEEFQGLVISDEINMLGLRRFYPTLDEMYIVVFASGNDVILNFNEDPNEIYRMIQVVRQAVERGEIPEQQIDVSVRKILQTKGFVVE